MLEPSDETPHEILLVEDNQSDRILTQQALLHARVKVQLHHVEDGDLCLAFLRKQAPFADAPTPELVLLDWSLPRMDGRQVLRALAADPALCHVPVVVYSTSDDRNDRLTAYRLGCRAYLVKQSSFAESRRRLDALLDYWFSVVALP